LKFFALKKKQDGRVKKVQFEDFFKQYQEGVFDDFSIVGDKELVRKFL